MDPRTGRPRGYPAFYDDLFDALDGAGAESAAPWAGLRSTRTGRLRYPEQATQPTLTTRTHP
jgi:hypothetical protein